MEKTFRLRHKLQPMFEIQSYVVILMLLHIQTYHWSYYNQ